MGGSFIGTRELRGVKRGGGGPLALWFEGPQAAALMKPRLRISGAEAAESSCGSTGAQKRAKDASTEHTATARSGAWLPPKSSSQETGIRGRGRGKERANVFRVYS